MIKNLILKSLLSLGIILSTTITNATEEPDISHKKPLSHFFSISPSGPNVVIDSSNVSRFLELTELDNSFERVNTLTITGAWTGENIGSSLRTLLIERIRHIDGALIRASLTITTEDLCAFNALIPRGVRVIKDSFKVQPDLFSDNKAKFLASFKYFSKYLEEYAIEVKDLSPKELMDSLPKTVTSFAISPIGRSSYYLTQKEYTSYSPTLRAFTLFNYPFDCHHWNEFLKLIPRHITRVSVINHNSPFGISTLQRYIDNVHDGVEALDFSCDIPIRVSNNSHDSSKQHKGQEKSPVLDVSRLPHLQALNLDGLGFPSDLQVKSTTQLTPSRNISRNPELCLFFSGKEMNLEDFCGLHVNIVSLKATLTQYANLISSLKESPIAVSSLIVLSTILTDDPTIDAAFVEMLKKKGCDLNSKVIGTHLLMAAEKQEIKLYEDIRHRDDAHWIEREINERDGLLTRAAKHDVVRPEGVLASSIIEKMYRSRAEMYGNRLNRYRARANQYKTILSLPAPGSPALATTSSQALTTTGSQALTMTGSQALTMTGSKEHYVGPPEKALGDLFVNAQLNLRQENNNIHVLLTTNESKTDPIVVAQLSLEYAQRKEEYINRLVGEGLTQGYLFYHEFTLEAALKERDDHLQKAEKNGVKREGHGLLNVSRFVEYYSKLANAYEQKANEALMNAEKYKPIDLAPALPVVVVVDATEDSSSSVGQFPQIASTNTAEVVKSEEKPKPEENPVQASEVTLSNVPTIAADKPSQVAESVSTTPKELVKSDEKPALSESSAPSSQVTESVSTTSKEVAIFDKKQELSESSAPIPQALQIVSEDLTLGRDQMRGLNPLQAPEIPQDYYRHGRLRGDAPASMKLRKRLHDAHALRSGKQSRLVLAYAEYISVINDEKADPLDRAFALLEKAHMDWSGKGASDYKSAYKDFELLEKNGNDHFKPAPAVMVRAKLYRTIMQNQMQESGFKVDSIQKRLQEVINHEGVLPQDKALAEAELLSFEVKVAAEPKLLEPAREDDPHR